MGVTRNAVPSIDGSSRYTSGIFMVVQLGGSESCSSDLASNGDAVGAVCQACLLMRVCYKELTLFGSIGKGISLYLSMCEEVGGCAPPVELDSIEGLIAAARAKLQKLKDVAAGLDGKVISASLQSLISRYEAAVRLMLKLCQEFVEIFGSGSTLPVLYPGSPFYEIYPPTPLDGRHLAQH